MCFAHGTYICDYRDYLSSGICELRDRKFCGYREYAAMSDPQRDIRLWAQAELAKRGHGAKGALAKFLDVRPDAITRMTNTDPGKESREIRAHELEKMRKFFGAEVTGEEETVPLVGYVGAGDRFYPEPADEIERVKAPRNPTPNTVAAQIRGDSMGSAFNGWLVYYDDVRSPVTYDMIGYPCVVALADGRVMVKVIRQARTPGLYHLESNEPTIYDVEIVWAAKVKSVEPR
jgi:hypothetical protein